MSERDTHAHNVTDDEEREREGRMFHIVNIGMGNFLITQWPFITCTGGPRNTQVSKLGICKRRASISSDNGLIIRTKRT